MQVFAWAWRRRKGARGNFSWLQRMRFYSMNARLTQALHDDVDVISKVSTLTGKVGMLENGCDVKALCKKGKLREAFSVFEIMDHKDSREHFDACICLLQSCMIFVKAKQIHACLSKMMSETSSFLGNTLINMYMRCGSVSDAIGVFNRMAKDDVCAWTTMIAGYVRHKDGKEALVLFEQMHKAGIKPDKVTFVSSVSACASLASLALGKHVHTHIIKHVFDLDVFVWSSLIGMYIKCGSLKDASHVLDAMPRQDVVSWNTLIAGYCQCGDWKEAFKLYGEMQINNVKQNTVTFVTLLSICVTDVAALTWGKQLHAGILNAKLHMDPFVGSTLVDMYAKYGCVEDAWKVFDRVVVRDIVAWNTMIAGYNHRGNGKEAIKLFNQIREDCRRLNEVTFISMLHACASITALEHGKYVHASIIKDGCTADVFVNNTIIDMYEKCNSRIDAHEVFDRMPLRDIVSWNSLIAGFSQHNDGKEAFIILQHVQEDFVRPDEITFVSVLSACAGDIKLGKWLHSEIIKSGFEADVFIGSALIDMYSKHWCIEEARNVFNKMPRRDVVMWNAMVAGYGLQGDGKNALQIYKEMKLHGVKANKVTFVNILTACAVTGAPLEEGRQVHDDVVNAGCKSDVFVCSSLIDMYAKCGSIKDARQVFDQMSNRNVVSWNTIITSYVQNEDCIESLGLFRKMHEGGIKPDDVTYIGILCMCANISALQLGKWIHAGLIGSGYHLNVTVNNTVIDMYAKCGSIEDADMVFKKMNRRDLVSWNAMLAGYGQHGDDDEALNCFCQMLQDGVRPNDVTFVSALTLCKHAYLFDEGFHYLKLMTSEYCTKPVVHHYACMVDLLGHAGYLDEAEQFITAMPFNPSGAVWLSLLAGCRVHNDLELAEQIVEYAATLEPWNSAPFVLLSNIYAVFGRFADTVALRKRMQAKPVESEAEPTDVWIEVMNGMQ